LKCVENTPSISVFPTQSPIKLATTTTTFARRLYFPTSTDKNATLSAITKDPVSERSMSSTNFSASKTEATTTKEPTEEMVGSQMDPIPRPSKTEPNKNFLVYAISACVLILIVTLGCLLILTKLVRKKKSKIGSPGYLVTMERRSISLVNENIFNPIYYKENGAVEEVRISNPYYDHDENISAVTQTTNRNPYYQEEISGDVLVFQRENEYYGQS